MPALYVNGFGGSEGADILTRSPVYVSGDIYFVSSATGNAAYQGTDRSKPLATLAAAHAATLPGDMIVLLSGHVETLTASLAMNKAGIRVRGEGTGTSRPKITAGVAGIAMDLTGAGVWLENIYFQASSTAPTTARVNVNSTNARIRSCYFACGANDTVPAVRTIANGISIESTEFESTATSLTAQPSVALQLDVGITDLRLDGVTFTAGAVGWSSYALFSGAAVTRLYGIDVAFTGGADFYLFSGTTGEFHATTSTGSVRGVWP